MNYKIKVTPEESRMVQEHAFEIGYTWIYDSFPIQ